MSVLRGIARSGLAEVFSAGVFGSVPAGSTAAVVAGRCLFLPQSVGEFFLAPTDVPARGVLRPSSLMELISGSDSCWSSDAMRAASLFQVIRGGLCEQLVPASCASFSPNSARSLHASMTDLCGILVPGTSATPLGLSGFRQGAGFCGLGVAASASILHMTGNNLNSGGSQGPEPGSGGPGQGLVPFGGSHPGKKNRPPKRLRELVEVTYGILVGIQAKLSEQKWSHELLEKVLGKDKAGIVVKMISLLEDLYDVIMKWFFIVLAGLAWHALELTPTDAWKMFKKWIRTVKEEKVRFLRSLKEEEEKYSGKLKLPRRPPRLPPAAGVPPAAGPGGAPPSSGPGGAPPSSADPGGAPPSSAGPGGAPPTASAGPGPGVAPPIASAGPGPGAAPPTAAAGPGPGAAPPTAAAGPGAAPPTAG